MIYVFIRFKINLLLLCPQYVHLCYSFYIFFFFIFVRIDFYFYEENPRDY